MAITLYHAATDTLITLPDDIAWTDEFSWDQVEQSSDYTTTGALLIEEQLKQAGRPYELQATQDRGFCTRAVVRQLQALAAIPGVEMVLTIRGTARNVTFDRKRGSLAGLPRLFYADGAVADTDPYVPTIRLLGL